MQCQQLIDDIAHGSQMQMQAQRTVQTSGPEHRLLCYATFRPRLVFIIPTLMIFIDLDSERDGGKAVTVPWVHGKIEVILISSSLAI